MEDIYDHLDNYDDVNALQELRSENQELKQKLEECTGAMGKLQKDYDDLALEFKKLEMNYSSLLKTARAEIERKTQIITNLNIEKDMMVLKSLQNGNNFRRSFYKGKANLNNTNNASKKKDHNKNSEDNQKNNTDNIIERKDKSSLESHEPVADSPMDSANKTSELGLVNTCMDKKSELKENHKHEQNPKPNIVASSISNRRKSMPAVSVQKEKFSSDDECEHKSPTKEIIKNYKPEQKLLSRGPNDTYGHKTSESSSLDGKSSNYQEHSRETQRNRPNRYYDDKYKSRDKYELSQRYRRHNSPDRGNRRPPREYRDDYHYKSEHGRYRVLVSPPPDPYHHNNHMSNYHQRRNREPRPIYDRYPNEYDRYRNRYAEKHTYKHKMANDHDEPSSKRPRTESFGITGHFQPDEEKRYADIEVDRVGVSGLGHTHDIHDESCQSPDYIQTEAISEHPVREIMNTASTPLEDPRRCSSKYVIKTGAEGVASISAVTGRNIDIKLIDKAAWNIERVDIPRALINHPSQFSEEVVHQIYMDIDNPVTNISMESGEICFDSEQMYSENDNKYREKVNENANSVLNKPMEEYPKSSQSDITINDDNTQTACSTKYRIPKIKHDKKDSEEKQRSAKLDLYKKVYKPNGEDKHKQEYNSDNCTRDSTIERLRNTKNKIYCNERNENSEILSEGKNRYQSQMPLSAKIIVEGDLELSDENSDVEINIPVAIERTDVQAAENRATVMSVAPSNNNEDYIGTLADKNDENLNNQEIDASTENKKETDGKKHKSKKSRKSKSKDFKLAPNNKEIIQVSVKKTRSKKDKAKPKEIDKKFSDLFGDSGSLIMPEDLGIATYVPSFDDAQDAVDLIIKQMNKHPLPNVNEVCNGKVEAQAKTIGNPNSSPNCHEIEINVENECGKVHHVDTYKTTSSKKNNEIVSPELPSNIVYENLNRDVIVDNSNVVKTVVISTGVQPQLDMECNVEPDLDKTKINMGSNPNTIPGASQNTAVNEFNRRELMKALATSTPQKEFETLVDMENRVIESSCSRVGSIDSIPSAVCQSERTLDSNADVPDVRIFVKRRRKVIKKPPAT